MIVKTGNPFRHTGERMFGRPKLGGLLGGLFLSALLLAGWAGCRNSPSPSSDSMTDAAPPTDTVSSESTSGMTYLGRFAMTDPSPLQLNGEDYTLHGVSVIEVSWPDSLLPTDAFTQRWEHMLAGTQSESYRGPDSVDGALVDEQALSRRLRAVLYRDGYAPEKMSWAALLFTEAWGVRLQKETWAGDERDDLNVLRTVADAYIPQPRPADVEAWFHVNRGGFALPFENQESVDVRFSDGDVEMTISLQSLREPPSQSTLQALFDGTWERAFATFGSSTTSLRNETRAVAGRDGREEILRFTEEDGTWVRFSWNAPGQAHSGTHPRMDIEMLAPADHYDSLLPLWNQTLTSLQLLDDLR